MPLITGLTMPDFNENIAESGVSLDASHLALSLVQVALRRVGGLVRKLVWIGRRDKSEERATIAKDIVLEGNDREMALQPLLCPLDRAFLQALAIRRETRAVVVGDDPPHERKDGRFVAVDNVDRIGQCLPI